MTVTRKARSFECHNGRHGALCPFALGDGPCGCECHDPEPAREEDRIIRALAGLYRDRTDDSVDEIIFFAECAEDLAMDARALLGMPPTCDCGRGPVLQGNGSPDCCLKCLEEANVDDVEAPA